jgi:hypothetical protein
MRPGVLLLSRIAIALIVGVIARFFLAPALVLGGISLFSTSERFTRGVLSFLGLVVLLSPLAGVAVSIPLIRTVRATFVGTLVCAYAGFAAALAYGWFVHTHSTGLLMEWFIIPWAGAASGAFIGASIRSRKSLAEIPWAATRRLDVTSVSILLLIVGSAAVVRAVVGVRDPEHVYDLAHRGVVHEVPEPPPEPQLERPPRFLDRQPESGESIGAASSVRAADGVTYVATASEGLRAISPAGQELWKFVPKQFSGRRANRFFRPLLAGDGTVYLIADSVYALSPKGQLQWAWRGSDLIDSGGAVILEDGTIVVATVPGGALFGITPQGKTKWRYNDEKYERARDLTLADDGTLRVHYQSSVVALDWRNR